MIGRDVFSGRRGLVFQFPMFRFGFLLLSLPYITCINNDASIYAQNQWISLSSTQDITSPSPPPPVSPNYQLSTTEILIIINNFIDTDRCAQSLQNYLQYAKYPKRLKFGMSTLSILLSLMMAWHL
jgi:hypothetical protein